MGYIITYSTMEVKSYPPKVGCICWDMSYTGVLLHRSSIRGDNDVGMLDEICRGPHAR